MKIHQFQSYNSFSKVFNIFLYNVNYILTKFEENLWLTTGISRIPKSLFWLRWNHDTTNTACCPSAVILVFSDNPGILSCQILYLLIFDINQPFSYQVLFKDIIWPCFKYLYSNKISWFDQCWYKQENSRIERLQHCHSLCESWESQIYLNSIDLCSGKNLV